MSVNDDQIQPGSDSFWEVGNYKRTVKRIDNGHHLCQNLKKLIETRSEIEKSYAKQLGDWSKQWNKFLEAGVEYGTMRRAWQGELEEAEKLEMMHNSVAVKLMDEVHTTIKQWQKEHYHKSMMHFKETKESDDSFKKAQKPWLKRFNKVTQAKKEYHQCCKQEKSTLVQENNAKGDASVSPEQLKKLQEKLEKCRKEVEVTQKSYEASLNDLNSSNPKYIEDMTEVFNRCQDFEHKRLEFFKEMLFGIGKCLNLADTTEYTQVYATLQSTIESANTQQDLKWWSNHNGTGMPMDWPRFEAWSPELNTNISKKGKSDLTSTGGITITSIKHKDNFSNDNAHYTTQSSTASTNSHHSHESSRPNSDQLIVEQQIVEQQPKVEQQKVEQQPKVDQQKIEQQAQVPQSGGIDTSGNPFDEGDEWEVEEEENRLVDDGRPGVPIRALYDYAAAEKDELTFKAGDILTKLDEVDGQGWCKGRKDGTIGLYPASYVEVI